MKKLTALPEQVDVPTEGSSPILRYFAYGHLPEGPLRDMSSIMANYAGYLDVVLPAGAEKATALRKLLEAKDAAVRAALDIESRA